MMTMRAALAASAAMLFLLAPPSLLAQEPLQDSAGSQGCRFAGSPAADGKDLQALSAPSLAVLRPAFSIPAMVVQGSSFPVRVASSASPGTSWDAEISTGFESYALEVTTQPSETSPDIWDFNLTVPVDTPEALFNLTVRAGGAAATVAHAVSVKDSMGGSFSFIHLTDTHIGATVLGGGYRSFFALSREINLIDPDFVVITGDICDKYLGGQEFPPAEQDAKFVECLMSLRVPAYVLSGNHDWSYVNYSDPAQNIEKFKAVVNRELNFSFDYGNCHFACLDTGMYSLADYSSGAGLSNESIAWLRSDLQGHANSTQRFVFGHHPTYPDWLMRNDEGFRAALRDCGVTAYFAGHVHVDSVFDANGTSAVGNASMGLTGPLHVSTQGMKYTHGYRLVRVSGSGIESFTYDGDGNGARDAATSLPMGLLNVTYSPSNAGAALSVAASVSNGLREDFSGAMLQFIMPKDVPGSILSIKGGYVERGVAAQNWDIYWVRANITRQNTTVVTLTISLPAPEGAALAYAAALSACSAIAAVWAGTARKRA